LALLQEFGVNESEIDEASPAYIKLCDWLLRAQIKELQYHKNRLSGEFSDDIEHTLEAVLKDDKVRASDVDQKQETITLQELLTKYMDETSRSAEWKPATEKEYRSLGKMTSFILGPDLPVSTIDHQTMNRFKEALQTIPSGAFRYNQFRGNSLEELLKIKHDNHLSVARVNGYLTSLGAVFRYAVRHGYMEKNFAEGLKLKQRKRPNKQQDIFDPGDLKTMFSSPDYIKDTHAEPHRFWLPVLGLFTGCRLEELCQLYLDDIRQIEGVWCLDLKEGRPDQSLKTASSERVVPLHPILTEELNLIGFAKKLKSRRRTRLFPELKRYQNKYSHYASKWFSEWKTKVGIQAPPREKTFHSFRHTFTDNLKQQLIEVSIVDELTGHAIQGESFGRYGKPYRLKTLLEEGVLKLNYKVDLSHLKSSKWVLKG
jgi:integrase